MRSLREGYGSKLFIAALTITTLVWALGVAVIPSASAASRHTEGSVVVNAGTVWYIGATMRHGFPTPEVYASYGYTFAQVQTATDGDMALPVGANRDFADGTLVNDNGTIWIISGGQKRGFPTPEIFNGLGYSFAMALKGSTANFTAGPVISSATAAHPAGALVNSNGTIWWITATGRKGIPSLEVFNSYGLKFSQVMPANAADLALTNEGTVAARNNGGSLITDGQTGGPVSVALAATNPGVMTLISNASAAADSQSVADLAHFNFTGTGTVSSLTLERIGVSDSGTVTDVYLFDGAKRITDSASFSSSDNRLTFAAGSLFAVNGSKTISVRADLAAGKAGQTIGVKVAAVNGSTVSVSGNIHNIANANLANSTVTSVSPAGGNVEAGSGVHVWGATFTNSGERTIKLDRLQLKQVGSMNNSDMTNFKLLIDSVQVATAASIDADGYLVFSWAGTDVLTTSAVKTLRVEADINGGASRTFSFSLLGAKDIGTLDTAYNAYGRQTSGTTITQTAVTISEGAVTVQKATDSPSSNVVKDAADQVLGKWTLKATGEAVKIDFLRFDFQTGDADVDQLRNGRVMINGSQYGSTSTLNEDSSATTFTDYTVNYTIPAGTTVNVELRADIFDADGTNDITNTDTITARLVGGNIDNARGQVSNSVLDVPGSTSAANQLTVAVGNVTLVKNASYPNQTTSLPKTAFKLGHWTLTGSSTEDINITTFSVDVDEVAVAANDFNEADMTNMYLKYGSNTTSTKATVSATDNNWAVSYNLAKNASVSIELYADLGSTVTANEKVKTDLTITGTAVQSGTATTGDDDIDGQTITAGASDIVEASDASMPEVAIHSDNSTKTVAAYKWTATNDNFTITEVTISFDSNNNANFGEAADAPTTVNTVRLMDGSTTVASRAGGVNTMTLTGLNVAVPANSTKVLTVQVDLGTVGNNAGTSGEMFGVALDGYKANNSQGTVTTDTTEVDGNDQYAYASIPMITLNSLPTTILNNGIQTLSKFTVASDGGSIAWKKVKITVAKTGGAAGDPTITLPTLWDVTSGTATQITAAETLVSTDTDGAGADTDTNCGETDAACTIVIAVGTDADDSAEQQISGSKTYEVRGTIGGTLASGDNIQTSIASPASFAAPDDYVAVSATTADFIWSDLSTLAHSTAAASTDWNNDYKVKNLPSSTQVLTK